MLKLFESGMLTELFWKFPNHLNQANPQSHQSTIPPIHNPLSPFPISRRRTMKHLLKGFVEIRSAVESRVVDDL